MVGQTNNGGCAGGKVRLLAVYPDGRRGFGAKCGTRKGQHNLFLLVVQLFVLLQICTFKAKKKIVGEGGETCRGTSNNLSASCRIRDVFQGILGTKLSLWAQINILASRTRFTSVHLVPDIRFLKKIEHFRPLS